MTQMVIGLFLLLTIGSPAAESNRNLHLFRAGGGEWHSLPSSELGRLWAHRSPVDVAADAAVSRHRFQLQLPPLTSTQTETTISGDDSTTDPAKRHIENSEISNDAIVMSFPFCTRLTVNECHRLLGFLEQKMRSLFSFRRKSFPPQIKRRRQLRPSSSTRSDLAEATRLSKFRRRLKRETSFAGNEASAGDERPETEIVGGQVHNDDDYDFLFDYEGEWTRKNDLTKSGNDQPKIAQKNDGVIQRKANVRDGGNRMLQLIGVGRLRRSEFRAPNDGETVEELLRRYRLWREENGYGRQTGRWGRSSQPVDDDVDDGNGDDDNDRVIDKPDTEDDQTTSNVSETNTDELPTDNRREIVMMTNENGNGLITRKRRSLVLEIHWPTEEQLTPQDWEMLESYVSWRKQHGYGLFSNRWGR